MLYHNDFFAPKESSRPAANICLSPSFAAAAACICVSRSSRTNLHAFIHSLTLLVRFSYITTLTFFETFKTASTCKNQMHTAQPSHLQTAHNQPHISRCGNLQLLLHATTENHSTRTIRL
jgi:hypothetical protein